MKRADDFEARRAHLKDLTDDQLHARFWAMTDQLTSSLLQAGRENTSPAIERSVLLRMGFSSLEAKAIVNGCLDKGLLQHGAGHVVLRLSREKGITPREAGLALCQGELLEDAARLFEEGRA